MPPPAVPVKHLAGNAVTTEKVKKGPASVLPGVLNTSGLTIQSAPSGAPSKQQQQQRQSSQQPSISITPLPRASASPVVPSKVAASPAAVGKAASQPAATPKPAVGTAATTPAKGVVCEICDNSIKVSLFEYHCTVAVTAPRVRLVRLGRETQHR